VALPIWRSKYCPRQIIKDDLTDKREAYHQAGVPEIWFIDPEYKRVMIDRKGKNGYVEEVMSKGQSTSSVLKGFWIEVSWLWKEPLPDEFSCLQKILKEK